MGRYARGKYGTAKYGQDLWLEYSVEPMLASITVDPRYQGTSSFTDNFGTPVYNRVQVSWLEPSNVDTFRLIRSNLGMPTSPTDPFSSIVFTYSDTGTPATNHGDVVHRVSGDPDDRRRLAYLDTAVEPGREYFYAIWVYLATPDEWVRAGETSIITSSDHNTLETLKGTLPAYMWNRYSGPGDGVAVLPDDDDQNFMGRWMQSVAWELDQSLTRIDLLRDVWDPQKTPSALLDDAVRTFGLPIEPALGARSQRALLYNAADITGGRGSLESIQLLTESLTGFDCTFTMGKNVIGTTDESSFEGVTVDNITNLNITAGTGRWMFYNSTLKRVAGDIPNSKVRIARDPNEDDDWGPNSRYGIHLDDVSPSAAIQMSIGDSVRLASYKADAKYGTIGTAWQHGLELGDKIGMHLNGTDYVNLVVLNVLDPFTIRVDAAAASCPLSTTITPDFESSVNGAAIITYQGVLVDPNTVYSLVGKFKSTGRQDITLTMNFYDRFGAYISQDIANAATLGVTVNNDKWYTLYLATTSPANAAVVTLDIVQAAAAGAPAGKYLEVDSLMVAPGGTGFEPVWTVSNKALVSNVATLTTTIDHGLSIGDGVTVAGVDATFNGAWTLTGVTHNTLSYAVTHANVTSVASGGTVALDYESFYHYEGLFDYTFEDSRLLTITVNTSLNPNGQPQPVTVQSDLIAVIQARLENILASYLPVGTAFLVNIV